MRLILYKNYIHKRGILKTLDIKQGFCINVSSVVGLELFILYVLGDFEGMSCFDLIIYLSFLSFVVIFFYF